MPLMPTTGEYKKLFASSYRSDILPRATAVDLVQVGQNSLFRLDSARSFPVNLPDSSLLYNNEKSSNVDRIGIPKKEIIDGVERTVYESFYFKPYSSPFVLYDKMVSSSLLGMHAVPHEPYGVIHDGRLGIITADLTNLRNAETKQPVRSVRFDILLNALGYAPDTLTFMDLQNIFYDEELAKIMDRRAFVQCALGNFFLANAFGETDSNSRNLILLENQNAEPMDEHLAKMLFGDVSPVPRKFGFAVRIDADENTHDTAKRNERSGNRIVGRSILFPNESVDSPMKLSRDDREILLEYSQNPEFVIEGSFIPPDGMTEREYLDQIAEDSVRIKKAKQIFEKQVLEAHPELAGHPMEIDHAVEALMTKHNVYARKKSFLQLIAERNPNIDWNLFTELFGIADKCVNETIMRFPVDSMYYRQSRIISNSGQPSRYQLSQDAYDDFGLSTLKRAENYLSLVSNSLKHYGVESSNRLGRLDAPARPTKLEPMSVDERGNAIVPKSSNPTELGEQ